MWIKTKNQLPPLNQYVLARYNGKNWFDKDDQANVNCIVAKFIEKDGSFVFNTFGPYTFRVDEIECWQTIEPL